MHDVWVALAGALVTVVTQPLIRVCLKIVRGDAEHEQSEIARLTARVGDLEELVDLLRKALDKHLIRESAIASAAELLIAIVKMIPKPSEAMLHIRDRAQRLLEDARANTIRIN